MKSHRDTVLWRQTQQTAYTTLKHRRRLFNNALGQNTSYDKENFYYPSFSIFVVPIAAEDIFITDIILKI